MHTSMNQSADSECFEHGPCLSSSSSSRSHGTTIDSSSSNPIKGHQKPAQVSPTSTESNSFNENSSTFPTSPSTPFTGHTIDSSYEIPARILFMAIKWCKSLPTFNSLPFQDQSILLEQTWSDMFLICALQCSLPTQPNIFLTINSGTVDRKTAKLLNEIVDKFKTLNLDQNEFSYLKAILLFKPGMIEKMRFVEKREKIFEAVSFRDAKGLREPHMVETIQDQAQLMLAQYIGSNQNHPSTRFGKLLLTLPILKQVDAASIERLYFTQIIGDSSIDKLLCDLIRT